MWFRVKFIHGSLKEMITKYVDVYLDGEYTEDDDEDKLAEEFQTVIARDTGILFQDIKVISFKII